MIKIRELGSLDAHELVLSKPGAILVDVRSTMEFLFVGHPIDAAHIAWIDEPDWEENKHFAEDIQHLVISRGLTKDSATLVLICRSGKRSHVAGNHLIQHGFSKVYNVSEGFEGDKNDSSQRNTIGGWRYHGLPWEQC